MSFCFWKEYIISQCSNLTYKIYSFRNQNFGNIMYSMHLLTYLHRRSKISGINGNIFNVQLEKVISR